MPRYGAYGLVLDVPFPCPLLPGEGEPDVVVVEGTVPTELAGRRARHDYLDVGDDGVLVRGGARGGRFRSVDGRTVVVERTDADDDLGTVFVHWLLPSVLRQHGLAVLHAELVLVDGVAVAIGGESGAGKSTTLAALVQRGFPMFSDDVSAVSLDDGRVVALPGAPHVHLFAESSAGLGLATDGLAPQAWRRDKYAVPTDTAMAAAPAPLVALAVLRPRPVADVRWSPVRGAAKLAVAREALFGPLGEADLLASFPTVAAVLAQVEVGTLDRPDDRWCVDEVVDAVTTLARTAGR